MKDDWVKIGFIANTHGIHGDLKVESLSDVPQRLLLLEEVYIGEEKQKVRIRSAREHKGMTLLSLEGYENINRVLPWKGEYLYVRESETETLPEGSWYHFQLIGLRAIDGDSGEIFGEVTDVLETYANAVLEIRKKTGDSVLIPFVDAFVGTVNIKEGTLALRQIEAIE